MASSIPQARNGTLYLMCGGARETFDAVKPVLEKLSTALRYIGTTGQAAQVKAVPVEELGPGFGLTATSRRSIHHIQRESVAANEPATFWKSPDVSRGPRT